MYSAYKYLFYRIYSWNLKTWGKEDIPQYNTIIWISVMIMANLLSILIIIEIIVGYEIIKVSSIPKIFMIIEYVIIFIFNYFLLVYNDKYLLIAKNFKSENKEKRRRRTKWMWSYIIGTHAGFFLLVYLLYLRLS